MIVADAGPLLHLHWVDASAWALPPQTIDVVESVWREVEAHAPVALQDNRLRRVPDPIPTTAALARWRLDEGEQAALSYAVAQRGADTILVLCDEREARLACGTLGLSVVGSIGLIVEACRAGRASLAEAETALRDLPGRGRLHVQRRLIEQAVALLHDPSAPT